MTSNGCVARVASAPAEAAATEFTLVECKNGRLTTAELGAEVTADAARHHRDGSMEASRHGTEERTEGGFDVLVEHDENPRVWRVPERRSYGPTENLGWTGAYQPEEGLGQRPIGVI